MRFGYEFCLKRSLLFGLFADFGFFAIILITRLAFYFLCAII